jgi:DNA polymerase-3 subunit delta'
MSSGAEDTLTLPPVLARLIGQPRAAQLLANTLQNPVHAYLFLGPAGSGKRNAARAFAAGLVCPRGGCGDCPACRDVLAGRHPDVTVVERQGASIRVEEARLVATLAQRTPSAGARQVIVLVDFHLVEEAAPALLKTIEEPPESTVFIVLADALPPPLVTIASRCLPVQFSALDEASISSVLMEEGIEATLAAAAAAAAHGRLDRAMLLAGDPGFAERQARWRAVPEALDGSGATVAVLAAELLAGSEEILGVLRARQAEELERAAALAERQGDRSIPGRQAIDARHRREQRRARTDELRAGLATLADAYRSRVIAPSLPARRVAGLLQACERIDEAAKWLDRNPNESMLLQALLLDLDKDG